MKHFITKTFAAAVALCAMAPMTVSAVEIQTGENSLKLSSGVVTQITPSASGALVIYSTSAIVARAGSLVYTNEEHTNALESSGKYVYADNDIYGFVVPAYGTAWEMTVEANTDYYIYYSNAGYSTADVTIILSSGSDSGGEVLEDVTLTSGVATPLLKGQKGIINLPANAPEGNSARIKVQLIANTTADLGDFITNQYNGKVTPEKEEKDGNAIYTFSSYVAYGPWTVLQNVEVSVTFTVSFPELEAIPTQVELDTPFDATQGLMYSFEVTEAPVMLLVKTSADLDWTNKLRAMIYTESGRNGSIEAQGEGTLADGIYTYTYVLSETGTYYMYCHETASYTLSVEKIENEKDPFQAEAQIVSPLAGVAEFYQVVVAWGNQVFDEDKSLFIGEPTITNPNGVSLSIRNPSLTPKDEGSSDLNALSLPLETSSWNDAKVLGDYTIYIPEGYIVNVDGEPNPETTLTYTLKPEAGDGVPDYFEIDGYYTNVPETYYLNSIEDLVITFPYDSLTVYNPETEDDGIDTQADDNYVTVYVDGEAYEYAELIGASLIVPVYKSATTENVNVQVRFTEAQIQNEEGLVNPPMTIQFTLYAGTEVAQFTPASENVFYADSESKAVNVSWNIGENVFIGFNNEDGDFELSGINVTDADGQAVELTWFDNIEENEAGNGYVISLASLAAGTYTVNIPVAAVSFLEVQEDDYELAIVGVALNAKASATYTLSEDNAPSTEEPGGEGDDTTGIYGIDSENGVNTIYNLQGVRVDNNKLNKGVYIINGKKVMVK